MACPGGVVFCVADLAASRMCGTSVWPATLTAASRGVAKVSNASGKGARRTGPITSKSGRQGPQSARANRQKPITAFPSIDFWRGSLESRNFTVCWLTSQSWMRGVTSGPPWACQIPPLITSAPLNSGRSCRSAKPYRSWELVVEEMPLHQTQQAISSDGCPW